MSFFRIKNTLISGFHRRLLCSCLRRQEGLSLLLVLALQLLSFVCKVVVLEGRNRPIRRVYTQKMGNDGKFAVLGLGWSVITRFLANPVVILPRQLPIPLHKVIINFLLYKSNREPVNKEIDSKPP